MKNIFWILLSCIDLVGCSATTAIDLSNSNHETLIASNYKVIEHGYFTFLVFVKENEVKELVYSYSINIKDKKVWCSKSSEKIYNISGTNRYSKDITLRTAEEFRDSQVNSWREKYYACFADNFLDMTNDEKMDLFNSLEKK
jgi:hypothetical protein